MRILLDTHIFLWFISGDPRLSVSTRELIQDSDNEVYLSDVSVWKSIIKYQLGALLDLWGKMGLRRSPHCKHQREILVG